MVKDMPIEKYGKMAVLALFPQNTKPDLGGSGFVYRGGRSGLFPGFR